MDTNQQQGGLPAPDDAYNTLFEGVHSRVFFNKLASYGIQWQTEKEAHDLLALAGNLRDIPMEKEAAAHESRFSGALSSLEGVLNQRGVTGTVKAAEEEMSIKQAAADLAADPAIYNSVLSLKAAEADMMAQQSQGQ